MIRDSTEEQQRFVAVGLSEEIRFCVKILFFCLSGGRDSTDNASGSSIPSQCL